MELNQLIQFKTIAECKTMTQAAEKLYISQPALSIMVRKFEDELGILLFDRKRNKISLNEAGEIALEHVNQVLNQIEQMKLDLYDFAHKDKMFKVGFCDPGPLWYSMPLFSMTHPNYELRSSQYKLDSNELELLQNEKYDVLVTDKIIESDLVSTIPFLSDSILLSVSENSYLSTLDSISLKDIKKISIALFYVGGIFYQRQNTLFKKLDSKISLELYDDFFLFQQYVKNTDIPTITTELVKNYRDDGNNRKLIKVIDSEMSIDYYIVFLKKNEQKLNVFLKWVNTL